MRKLKSWVRWSGYYLHHFCWTKTKFAVILLHERYCIKTLQIILQTLQNCSKRFSGFSRFDWPGKSFSCDSMHPQILQGCTMLSYSLLSFYKTETISETKLIYHDETNTSLPTIILKKEKKGARTTSKHQVLSPQIIKFKRNVPFI